MNKEEIYDSEISPHMVEIIRICKEHQISMVASFSIPTEEDEGCRCTTALLVPEWDPPEDFKAAYQMVHKSFVAFTSTVRTSKQTS